MNSFWEIGQALALKMADFGSTNPVTSMNVPEAMSPQWPKERSPQTSLPLPKPIIDEVGHSLLETGLQTGLEQLDELRGVDDLVALLRRLRG